MHFPRYRDIPKTVRWRFVHFVLKGTKSCNIFWVPQMLSFHTQCMIYACRAEIISIHLSVSSLYGDEKHGVVSFGQRFEQERETGSWSARDVDVQQEPCGNWALQVMLCYWCVWRRGYKQHPLARYAFSWERILACCFKGVGFRWGKGKVWLLCTTGLRTKLTSQTIGRRVLSLHT